MDKRELARIALSEGDIENRISALLDLLEIPSYECKLPEGKLNIPEETCMHYSNGECWVDVPDSVQKCNGKCSSYKQYTLLTKE